MRGGTNADADADDTGGGPPPTRPRRSGPPTPGAGCDPTRSSSRGPPRRRGDRRNRRDRPPRRRRRDGVAGPGRDRREGSDGGTAAPAAAAIVPPRGGGIAAAGGGTTGTVRAAGAGGGEDGGAHAALRYLRAVAGRHSDSGVVDVPKDRINDFPFVPYGRTKNAAVVVSTAAESERAVGDIRAELLSTAARRRRCRGGDGIADRDDDDDDEDGANSFQYVGFDTETRPKFHRGGKNHPPALIQIATESTAYLFRLTFRSANGDCAMTDSLTKLLSDPDIVKVGIGIRNDARELECAHGRGCCGDGSSYLDLGPLVGLRWPGVRRAGLRNLAATVLGYRLSKAQQMKNWEEARLTPAMVAYAASDAHVALDLLAAIVGGSSGCGSVMRN